MNIKVLMELTPTAKKFLILNNKPINLNKGMAKKVLDKTLSGLDKSKSPFIDYGLLRLERVPNADTIKIISKLENSNTPDEFIISGCNSINGKNSYKLENADSINISHLERKSAVIAPPNKNMAIKEKVYTVLDFIKEANKIFKPFKEF